MTKPMPLQKPAFFWFSFADSLHQGHGADDAL
jgi:hypothetical protein